MRITHALARAAVVAPFIGLALAAAPADAATRGPVSAGSCYFDNGNGTITAVFSYTDADKASSTIPIGADNQVYVGTSTANYTPVHPTGQPTTFVPGGQSNVFTVTGPPNGGAAWYLNGAYATVLPGSGVPLCPSGTSLPTTDGMVLTLVALAGLTPLGCWLLGRRSTRLSA